MSILTQNHLGSQYGSLETTLGGHAHISPQARIVKIRKSAQEGRRDFIFSSK